MDELPEEILRLILCRYLGSHDACLPSLPLLATRFAHACLTCSDWRGILMDTYTPHPTGCSMTFDELEDVLSENLLPSSLSHRRRGQDGCRDQHKHVLQRLFDTHIGRLDLIGTESTALHRDRRRNDTSCTSYTPYTPYNPYNPYTPHTSYTSYTSFTSFTSALSHLASFPTLKLNTLHITAPKSWSTHDFDCTILRPIPHLAALKIHNFKNVTGLSHLPPTLQSLDVHYGEVFDVHVLSTHGISILDLPPQLTNLKFLRVSKNGTVGLVSRQLVSEASSVVDCHINCKYLLLAVTVGGTVDDSGNCNGLNDSDGLGIVSLFRNPFMEGRYVPPHVLADWDMIEASHRATDVTCSQLLEQIARAPRLKRLRIRFQRSEEASVKVIPTTRGEEVESLQWVSSISSHQSQLLFGFNGEEFRGRLDVLVGVKSRRGVACEALKRLRVVDVDVMEQQGREEEGVGVEVEEGGGLCEFRVGGDEEWWDDAL